MHRLAETTESNLAGTLAAQQEQLYQQGGGSPNFLAAMWRYRWAVALPAVLGAVIGFVVYLQMPDRFRSTTRLIVESDRSPMLDAVTGEIVGGVPGVEVVQSQLFSDQVIRTAFEDARMIPFHDQYPGGLADFIQSVVEFQALQLEPEFSDEGNSQEVVILLHFDSGNEELSETAVKSFSEALQEYYNRKHKSSRSELLAYMVHATERLYPDMRKMKEEYRKFRRDAPLQWDASGSAINPYREHQMFLVQRRAELQEELRVAQTEHAAVKAVTESNEDPEVSLAVIGQLLERRFTLPDLNLGARAGFAADDEALEGLKVERDLVPLMVALAQMQSEYGADHPKVKTARQQLDGLREELRRLVKEQTDRVGQLIDTNEKQVASRGRGV